MSQNPHAERCVPSLPTAGAAVRLVIDADAANEVDDLREQTQGRMLRVKTIDRDGTFALLERRLAGCG
jgi:hypothetical protein